MKRIIAVLVLVLFLAGCGPGKDAVAPECTLGTEVECTGFEYDKEGFTINLKNNMNAEIEDIVLKIEKCPGSEAFGSLAKEETKTFGIKCEDLDGVFESNMIATYRILGTNYLKIGKIVFDAR